MKCKYCGEHVGKDYGGDVGIVWECDDKECGELRMQEVVKWLSEGQREE